MKYNIKQQREKLNMTQAELAEKSGCSRQFINKIENSDSINVSSVVLVHIAKALNTTVDSLLFGS